jgi:serine/threonine protein kinase
MILDEGEEIVDGYTIPNVPYLIFEMADGDIRSHLKFNKDLEVSWKLKSLHDVSLGLQQLHGVKIGHQDLKPSNVLLYEDGLASKIGDLGRSLCEDIEAPHDDGGFVGDFKYAPPEFLYNYKEPDFNLRIKATDLYLFGSLVVFYFTGVTMNSLLSKNLSPEFRWNNWRGSFYEVSDYLINGYYKALKEFKNSIEDSEISLALVEIVEYCCFPIPSRRGHPKTIRTSLDKDGNLKPKFNQYSLERVVSRLDLLKRKSVFKFK